MKKAALIILCVCIFGFVLFALDYQMGRPIAQRSTATEKIVSVELRDGTKLKPNDPGFDEAVKKATFEWVQ